ncbi:calcium-transporting ATPase 12, plasma membrane-type-like [Fagus crenata]
MLTTSSGHDGDLDLESQQTVLLKPTNSLRVRWRAILLILQVRNKLRACIADKGSLDRSVSSSTSYYSTITSLDDLEADPQIVEIVEIISDSSQVSITVNLEGEDGENDDCSRDAKLQQANISKMVKEKNLDSIQMFGGVQVIAEALGTDLEKGITSFRLKPKTLSTTQTTALGFFRFLPKSCNNYTILLLLVSAVLSLGFGIKEEGLRTGWYEGVIIILAIFVLVFSDSIREYRLKHSHKMSGRQRPLGIEKMVPVIREGDLEEVFIYDVLLGDIVFLDRDYFVPADGLFISGGGGGGGEFLKVDNDSESIINEENPFLFYGAQVIDGNGFMLVASVGMDTKWGDLMKQVIDAPDKASLPAQLDKVNTDTQITGLIISIIILVVLFLRFMLRNEHVNSNLPDFKGELIGNKERMNAIVKIFLKPSGKIITLTTSLATLLVGVMEGIPFVIALAISYWNKKILFVKAFAQEIFACLTMSSVTTICIDTTSLLNDPEADGREIQMAFTETAHILVGVPRLNCVQWNHSYDTLYSSTPSDLTSNLEMPLTGDGTRI